MEILPSKQYLASRQFLHLFEIFYQNFKENLHNPNIKLAFFRNPSASSFASFWEESGFREIFGTHHMKINIFDNNVLLSG